MKIISSSSLPCLALAAVAAVAMINMAVVVPGNKNIGTQILSWKNGNSPDGDEPPLSVRQLQSQSQPQPQPLPPQENATNGTANVVKQESDPSRVALFIDAVNAELTKQNIRGAAYAFRGPGMAEPIMGWHGKVASSPLSPNVDADTAFMLASVSKPFIGSALAVLIDRGQLSLDDDICDVLGGPVMSNGEPNTACRNPFFPDIKVTWRMLATHRSSINSDVAYIDDNTTAEYGPIGVNLPYNIVGNPTCPLNDTQQFFEDLFVNKVTETTVGNVGFTVNWYQLAEDIMGGMWNDTSAPGDKNLYSNVATAYMAALIEKKTGKTFDQFCKENVFVPAGMNHTSWFREDLPKDTTVAVPVYPFDEISGTWEDVGHFCFITYASGQLYSTIRDMSHYADLMLSYGIGTLWSSSTAMDHVFGCQEKDALGTQLRDDSEECSNALLWFHLSNAIRDLSKMDPSSDVDPLEQLDWTNGVTHDGSETGAVTEIIILPEAKMYAMVLLNTAYADSGYLMKVLMLEGMALANGKPPVGPSGYGENGDDDSILIGSETQPTPVPIVTTPNNASDNIFDNGDDTEGLVTDDSESKNQTSIPGNITTIDAPNSDLNALNGSGCKISMSFPTILGTWFVAILGSLLFT